MARDGAQCRGFVNTILLGFASASLGRWFKTSGRNVLPVSLLGPFDP